MSKTKNIVLMAASAFQKLSLSLLPLFTHQHLEAMERPVLVLPHFEEFGNMFHDRCHILLSQFLIFKHKFSIILNLVDRGSPENSKKEVLVYAGVDKQRQLLDAEDDGLDEWEKLKEIKLDSSKAAEGSKLFLDFRDNQLSIEEINEIKYLKNYFPPNPEEIKREGQKSEYPILNRHFKIAEDRYLSLPVIAFGRFEGVAHIVFQEKEVETSPEAEKRRPDILKQIILIFSNEYENLSWRWETAYESVYEKSRVNLEALQSKDFYDKINKNPILKELNFRGYYTDSADYIQKSIDLNDLIPKRLLNEHRKRAIIAILIDSYAHNISAHSLTVLNWWFRQRAAIIKESKYDQVKYNEIMEKMHSDVKDMGVGEEENIIASYRGPLATELQPLLKFLLEKGAFWSGMTRGITFGGEIENLYNLLWHDFVNNPLYLGTIAHSERVRKISIHVTVFESNEEDQGSYKNTKTIKRKGSDYLDGHFAQINFQDQRDPQIVASGGLEEGQSIFVELGDKYALLKDELLSHNVFFPGGVVGKHSFFTLLENEIRNVKHFRGEVLEEIRKNGLILNLSIHARHVNTASGVDNSQKHPEIYKIGVWLKHPVELRSDLVVKRLDGLREDIITSDTHQPRLGGSYQDKICAAMLFNNDFTSVQNGSDEEEKSTDRERRYYPWIKAASVLMEDIAEGSHTDFEISSRRFQEVKEDLPDIYQSGKGYLKKYFHVWQGFPIYHAKPGETWAWENVSRFKFVNLPKPGSEDFQNVRKEGVIRILEKQPAGIGENQAYKHWLDRWLKPGDEKFRIRLVQGNSEAGHIVHDGDGTRYYDQRAYLRLDKKMKDDYGDYPQNLLRFSHSGIVDDSDEKWLSELVFSIRSNGILMTKFFEGLKRIEDFDTATITDLHLHELVEVLKTKICIFDNRVAERVREDKRKFLHEKLLCGIHNETEEAWNAVKEEGLRHYHFVIMHLSFIEGMKDEKGRKYGEKGIDRFIEREILSGDPVGANGDFILVITTGRGRTEWWSILEKTPYAAFTTFRPVESLIEATEKPRLKKDDIELKYNLIKVLFGS